MTADGFSLSKSDLLATHRNDGAEAETLAGRAINCVHNALSSDALLSEKDRKDRAQHSDQLAEVVADSVAMLPGLRLPAAGLLRATALAHVSGDLSQFAGNYAKDFVEGAALQKVSSSLLPEGAIGKRLSLRLGNGLAAETANFAIAGSGMAAVTTAFRPDSWLDQNKNFSLTQGGENVFKASLVGAAMSAPAGLIGSRITRAGLTLGAEGRISRTSALALAGVGSGYLSGSAIGGAQAYLAGGDFKTVLASMNESGIAGALSGAVAMPMLSRIPAFNVERSAAKLDPTPTDLPRPQPVQEASIHSIAEANKAPFEKYANTAHADDTATNASLELWKSLEISESKLHDTDASLRDRVEKLGVPFAGKMRYYETVKNADEIAASSKNLSEFMKNGGMRFVEDTVRHYNVDGRTITIPETYAKQLDEVLALRLKAAEDPDLYVKGPAHAREVLQAQIDLEEHPLKLKAHPADFVNLLAELPDRSLVKDIFIRQDRSPHDAWTGKEYEAGFKAAATAGEEDSRITFYDPNRSSFLRNVFKHEWGHLLKWAAKSESSRFDQAVALEKDGFHVTTYAKRNEAENWSEHLASLLEPESDKFFATAHGAPLRTVELARALMKSFGAVPRHLAGTHQLELSQRLAYIQQNVLPEAQAILVQHLASGNKDNAVIAANLLSKIGGEREFNLLSDMAKTEPDLKLRQAAFNGAWGSVYRTSPVGYGETTSYLDKQAILEFLVSQSAPESKSRDSAISLLARMEGPRSKFYHDLVTLDNYEGNKLSRSLALMDDAPDAAGLKHAWQQALKIAGPNPDLRVDLALRALHKYPRLHAESVDILAREAQPRTRMFLRDMANHYDERVASRARQGLQQIDLTQRLTDLNDSMSSANLADRLKAAEAAAATRTPQAASAIIKSYLSAETDAEQTALAQIMRKYISPEIWKFELRRQKAANPAQTPTLNRLMNASHKVAAN